MLLVSAAVLADNCQAVSSTATSITFRWPSATSVGSVTYYLGNETTAFASTATNSATVASLTAATNYTFTLYASTVGPNSKSNTVSCAGWTGELFDVCVPTTRFVAFRCKSFRVNVWRLESTARRGKQFEIRIGAVPDNRSH